MIHQRLADHPWKWLMWLGGLLCIGLGLGAIGMLGGLFDLEDDPEDSPVHVEELQVAEPLTDGTEAVIRDHLRTVAAVTEPYEQYDQEMAESEQEEIEVDADFDRQCTTVLKEIAFCSNEDEFLDIIGTASNLRTGSERQGFMERVDVWFEPGGSRRDCRRVSDHEETGHDRVSRRWQRAAEASGALCEEFGETLLEVELFGPLGMFWEDDQEVSR